MSDVVIQAEILVPVRLSEGPAAFVADSLPALFQAVPDCGRRLWDMSDPKGNEAEITVFPEGPQLTLK